MNEKILIKIIKYTPSIFILILSVVITLFVYQEHKTNTDIEKSLIEKKLINEEKEETKAWIDSIYQSLVDIKINSEKELKNDLKNQVNNAYHIAYKIFNKYKNTKSQEEIEDLIKSALRPIRNNDGRGYFFIYERTGKNILNSDFPEIEGKNLWNYKDLKGKPLIQEMYKFLENESETFYEWYWHKAGDKKNEYKKLGFFKKFEPYDWFIGTGEYIDDFEQTLKHQVLNYITKIRYKEDRYVFVADKNGIVLANKYQNLIGKNLISEINTFDNVYKHINELKDGKFIDYRLDKDFTTLNSVDKISYIRWIDEWGWIIGSGFNLGKINEIIHLNQKHLEEKYNKYLKDSLFISLVLIFALLLISHIISRFIEKSFYKYKSNLEEKHNTLVKAQQTAHIGDWRLNLNTSEIYWSDELYNIMGVINHNQKIDFDFIMTLTDEEGYSCINNSLNDAKSTRDEQSCIYKITKQTDNSTAWVECRSQLNFETNIIYGTIQDVTRRKLLEEEKDQKEAILYQQSKMAAMGEMLGNIAHQWRQPLSVITTSATGARLQNEMGLLDKNALNEALDNINDTAQYLSQTIDDFRLFFKPKGDQKSDFKIESVIDKTLSLMGEQFKSNHIQIIKNIKDVEVNSLKNELVQALINIFNNSRDALSNLNKEEKVIFIDAYSIKENLVIEIKDNANGIPAHIIDRIFEPYFTTKHQSQGTGIGLYMTQQIINKLLLGSIIVKNEHYFYENKEHVGANFIITIPLH